MFNEVIIYLDDRFVLSIVSTNLYLNALDTSNSVLVIFCD